MLMLDRSFVCEEMVRCGCTMTPMNLNIEKIGQRDYK